MRVTNGTLVLLPSPMKRWGADRAAVTRTWSRPGGGGAGDRGMLTLARRAPPGHVECVKRVVGSSGAGPLVPCWKAIRSCRNREQFIEFGYRFAVVQPIGNDA